MKLAIIVVLIFVAWFVFLLAGVTNSDYQETTYQSCMKTAKNLRSDSDTKAMERICDSLPVDPRDMRN